MRTHAPRVAIEKVDWTEFREHMLIVVLSQVFQHSQYLDGELDYRENVDLSDLFHDSSDLSRALKIQFVKYIDR